MSKQIDTESSIQYDQPSPDVLALERARFEYCERLYRSEDERKERIEKRAEFYLSVLGIALGVLSLKNGPAAIIGRIMHSPGSAALFKVGVYIAVAALMLSLVFSLFSILQAMALKKYKPNRPSPLVSSLFSPETRYFDGFSEASFLREIAQSFALATESNGDLNAVKAVWVRRAGVGVLVALASVVMLGVVAFISGDTLL